MGGKKAQPYRQRYFCSNNNRKPLYPSNWDNLKTRALNPCSVYKCLPSCCVNAAKCQVEQRTQTLLPSSWPSHADSQGEPWPWGNVLLELGHILTVPPFQRGACHPARCSAEVNPLLNSPQELCWLSWSHPSLCVCPALQLSPNGVSPPGWRLACCRQVRFLHGTQHIFT